MPVLIVVYRMSVGLVSHMAERMDAVFTSVIGILSIMHFAGAMTGDFVSAA